MGESKDVNVGLTSRGIIAAGGASLAWSAPAQGAPPRVTLTTGAGAIELELSADKAPISAANFLAYVDQKRLDGASFYRAMKLAPDLSLSPRSMPTRPRVATTLASPPSAMSPPAWTS